MEPIDILIAKDEIRELKARYWRYVDTKQWDSFIELFRPEATFSDHSADFHCADRASIAEAIPTALADVTSVHRGLQYEIEVLAEDRARGIWAMEDYLVYPPGASHPPNPGQTSSVRGYGHYVETYAKSQEGWRFVSIDLYRLRLEVDSYSSTDLPPDLLR